MIRAALAALCLLPIGFISFTPAQPAKGKKYALLIGITEYKHANLAALKYAENDVEQLADILKSKSAGFDDVQVLTVARGKKKGAKRDQPTKANIDKALDAIFAKKGRNDTVLIALSGHGVQLEVEDPQGKLPNRTYRYFCPTDADFNKIRFSNGDAPQLINLDDVFKRLGDCGASTRLILVDACRNEIKADSTTRTLDMQRMTIPVGVGAMFSCKSGERAWETSKVGKGHGIFFYYVLQGLRGEAANEKGEVRWSRLAEYASEQVSEQVPKIIGGGAKQTPHAAQNIVGASPILNVTAPKKIAPATLTQADKHYRLGRDLMLGINGKKIHRVRAEEEFKKAAKDNHPMAIVALARCYLEHGKSISKQQGAAISGAVLKAGLETRAAEGDPDALVELGHLYRSGFLKGKQGETKLKVYDTFKRAAEQGNLEALYMVGVCYGTVGLGVERDYDKELRYNEDAARKGLAVAQFALGRIYAGHRPMFPVKPNEKKAFEYFKAAAEQGHADALWYYVGYFWAGKETVGTKQDEKLAVSLLHQAAEQRHKWAPHTLGQCYMEGRGVKQNYKEAVKYLEQAEKQGVAAAVFHLGKVYATGGDGVPRDDKKAIEYLEKATKLSGYDNFVKEAKEMLAKLKK